MAKFRCGENGAGFWNSKNDPNVEVKKNVKAYVVRFDGESAEISYASKYSAYGMAARAAKGGKKSAVLENLGGGKMVVLAEYEPIKQLPSKSVVVDKPAAQPMPGARCSLPDRAGEYRINQEIWEYAQRNEVAVCVRRSNRDV